MSGCMCFKRSMSTVKRGYFGAVFLMAVTNSWSVYSSSRIIYGDLSSVRSIQLRRVGSHLNCSPNCIDCSYRSTIGWILFRYFTKCAPVKLSR